MWEKKEPNSSLNDYTAKENSCRIAQDPNNYQMLKLIRPDTFLERKIPQVNKPTTSSEEGAGHAC